MSKLSDDKLVPAKCINCGHTVGIWGGPLMTTPDRPYAYLWGHPYTHTPERCEENRRKDRGLW